MRLHHAICSWRPVGLPLTLAKFFFPTSELQMDLKTRGFWFWFMLLCISQIILLGIADGRDDYKKVEAPIIGIYLGNMYSSVGVEVQNDIVIIQNDQGNKKTPSFVSFTDTGILIGEDAKNQTALNQERTIFNFRQLIGRNFDDPEVQRVIKSVPYKIVNKDGKPYIEVKVNGETKVFSPEDITAMVFEKMKDMAELYLGKNVTWAVFSVPAHFNTEQGKATEKAAQKTGLNAVAMSEAAAVASAYGLHSKAANIMVFDFGISTFDVTILSVTFYGGAFKELAATSVGYSDAINLLGPLKIQELNVELFNKTVEKALEDAGLKKTDIDEIIVEGVSSTRLSPNVRPLLKNLFNGKEPITGRFNAYEVFAFGAAVIAAEISKPSKPLLNLPTPYPHSFGIEIDGGVMMKMTPPNTYYLPKSSQTFTTCQDHQTTVTIKVYEGEENLTKDCRELGRFHLSIPPAPRGVPQIEVTIFEGIYGDLNVITEDKATNKSESLTLSYWVLRNLSREEYAKYIEKMVDLPGTSLKPYREQSDEFFSF